LAPSTRLQRDRPSVARGRDTSTELRGFQITGTTGHPGITLGAFVTAFENLPGGGDRDYNDLVVEVQLIRGRARPRAPSAWPGAAPRVTA
jgi:hypothetical protein